MKNKIINYINTDLVVIGGGPGGYTAAFRAADLNINTIIIEENINLGGTCLNHGCIPTKSLLHISKLLNNANYYHDIGLISKIKNININNIQIWKNNIIKKIHLGLISLCAKKKIKIISGTGSFKTNNSLHIENNIINFKNAIIATGSTPIKTTNKYIINSDQALQINNIKKKILIIGAGIVSLELANIYSSFNSTVDIIEKSNDILMDIDDDIKLIFKNKIKNIIRNIFTNTTISNIDYIKKDELIVKFSNKKTKKYNKIISATGRIPNIKNLGLKNIKINIDKENFLIVNKKQQTNIKNIYACGDITGKPMLSNKAIYEAKIAAEVIAEYKHYSQKKCIPYVIYSNPEIACVGISELEAQKKNIKYKTGIFPWYANGKAIITNSEYGMTKIIFKNNRIIGACIIGDNTSELISELALAIEMECHEDDLSLTIHPHPTLSETIPQATDLYKNISTDL